MKASVKIAGVVLAGAALLGGCGQTIPKGCYEKCTVTGYYTQTYVVTTIPVGKIQVPVYGTRQQPITTCTVLYKENDKPCDGGK